MKLFAVVNISLRTGSSSESINAVVENIAGLGVLVMVAGATSRFELPGLINTQAEAAFVVGNCTKDDTMYLRI